MHITVVGLNHNSAPVEVREQLSVKESDLPRALERISSLPDVLECAILSTCNRTEAYATLLSHSDSAIVGELAAIGHLKASELHSHIYVHRGTSAVRHLFRVASGVDSMIVGENQVLGQVRQAFEKARDSGSTGSMLNRLFESALSTGKRVRTETEINKGAASVGSAAVDLAKSIFGDLAGRRLLLLGAGKMGEIVADRLLQSGADGVIVANRTFDRAQKLAASFGGRAVRYDDFETEMVEADIVIASTGAPHYIVKKEQLVRILDRRRYRPIFLIDIAVPRDIEPSIAEIDCAFLYNIDDLNSIVNRTVEERKRELSQAEDIIEEGVEEFMRWQSALLAVPVIKGLRGRLERIADEEVRRYSGRLSGLSEKDRRLVDELVKSVINKITHHPITHIKDYASQPTSDRLQTVVEVFGLDHEAEEQEVEWADWRGDGI